eukprot:354762-Chlamydomonas_euryale.AAC.11
MQAGFHGTAGLKEQLAHFHDYVGSMRPGKALYCASTENDSVFCLLECQEVPGSEGGSPSDETHKAYAIAKFEILLDDTALRITGMDATTTRNILCHKTIARRNTMHVCMLPMLPRARAGGPMHHASASVRCTDIHERFQLGPADAPLLAAHSPMHTSMRAALKVGCMQSSAWALQADIFLYKLYCILYYQNSRSPAICRPVDFLDWNDKPIFCSAAKCIHGILVPLPVTLAVNARICRRLAFHISQATSKKWASTGMSTCLQQRDPCASAREVMCIYLRDLHAKFCTSDLTLSSASAVIVLENGCATEHTPQFSSHSGHT